ncbi:MAG: B12-binding domain-containing protein [Devosiaceae bacterium]
MAHSHKAQPTHAMHEDLGSASAAPGAPPSLVQHGLIHTIEGEVIPRLLLAHQAMLREEANAKSSRQRVSWNVDEISPENLKPEGTLRVEKSDVVAFAELLIAFEANVARRFISAQIARGFAVSDLLLDLCGPAACELGDMWLRDDCSFCDVTVGLSSLEHVILACSTDSGGLTEAPSKDRSALLAAMPGNQHVFGLLIVKDLFRRNGWSVCSPNKPSHAAIVKAVRGQHFNVLGLSVGSRDDLPACHKLIKACRNESLNPRLLIVVGGYGIQEATLATRTLDADLIARDGREGIDQIERLLSHFSAMQHYN